MCIFNVYLCVYEVTHLQNKQQTDMENPIEPVGS